MVNTKYWTYWLALSKAVFGKASRATQESKNPEIQIHQETYYDGIYTKILDKHEIIICYALTRLLGEQSLFSQHLLLLNGAFSVF